MLSISQLVRASVIATLALLLAGCAQESPPAPSSAELGALKISGDEVEPYQGFDRMRESADLAVLGELGDAKGIRTVGEPGSEAYLLQFEVKPDSVMGGSAPDSIVVEFTLGAATREQAEAAQKVYSEALAGREAILYLRAKQGRGEAGLYRPVNSLGFWTATQEAPVSAPLAEMDPATLAQFRTDLATADSLDDVVTAHGG